MVETWSDQGVAPVPIKPWSVTLYGNRRLKIQQLLLNAPTPAHEWEPCKIIFSFQFYRQQKQVTH